LTIKYSLEDLISEGFTFLPNFVDKKGKEIVEKDNYGRNDF